jgi:lipopolysaccharide export system permease protein
MRTLQGYLVRQVLASLIMTVVVFTCVLLLGNVFKEVLAHLVNRQASLADAGRALLLLIPFVLVFALPMGLLTATLLVFGRFSADHELTAVRASGVSLVSLITPILLLGVVMSVICAVVNLQLAPQCRVAYKRLLASVAVSGAGRLLPEKTFIREFPDRIVYIGRVRGQELKDVLIYNLDKDGQVDNYIRATTGRIQITGGGKIMQVELFEAWRVGVVDGQRTPFYADQWLLSYTNQPHLRRARVQLSDLTFRELREQLQELEGRTGRPLTTDLRLTKRQREAQNDLTLPIRVQMHRQVAFSFAALGFTLVGIPLGIRAHRRETTFGMAMALVLVLIYYSFFVAGQALDANPEWFPHLVLWIPNFLFQAVGLVLLWRANRGL